MSGQNSPNISDENEVGKHNVANDALKASYDELPYRGHSLDLTHPDFLAAQAVLFGLAPPNVETCRVLELGCGDGSNLIPMAITLPNARFLGVDLSDRHIEEGREDIERLCLANIELKQADLLDFDSSYGQFDYIICHGVFSWVPTLVRDKILCICRDHLSANGIAYISFNTFPGWHLRGVMRDVLQYQASRGSSVKEALALARGQLTFLTEAIRQINDPYANVLREEVKDLTESVDTYLFHEFMEVENNPLYFHEFVKLLDRESLRYVGDVGFDCFDCKKLSPELHESLLAHATDHLDFEQQADFVRGRRFRRALIGQRECEPQRPIDANRLTSLWLSSAAKSTANEIRLDEDHNAEFMLEKGAKLNTNNPVAKALLQFLIKQWPRRVHFAEVHTSVTQMLHRAGCQAFSDASEFQTKLANLALYFTFNGFAMLHANAPRVSFLPSERPLASPLARLQAARGSKFVTNLLHLSGSIDPIQRIILPQLDGSHDCEAILDVLVEASQSIELDISEDGKTVSDPERKRQLLRSSIEQSLQQLASAALLIE